MALVKFKSKVVDKKKLVEDIYQISLEHPPELAYEAGQYIQIKCVDKNQEKWKSYSILNPPSERKTLDICVKIIKDGFASDIFKKAQKGDEFEVKGPMGLFRFEYESTKESWFLCSGTGVTPFYSMIHENVPKKPDHKFILLFGVRTKEDLFFEEDFKNLQNNYNNFEFHPVLSRENWEGKLGHVQQHLPENLAGKNFYICGLTSLVQETEEILVKKGVEKQNIKKEKYA